MPMTPDPDAPHTNAFERFTREVVERLTRIEERLENRTENHETLKIEVASLRTEQQRHATTLAGHRTVIAILAAIGTALLAAVIGLLFRVAGR